jgi:hypothetical protein
VNRLGPRDWAEGLFFGVLCEWESWFRTEVSVGLYGESWCQNWLITKRSPADPDIRRYVIIRGHDRGTPIGLWWPVDLCSGAMC